MKGIIPTFRKLNSQDAKIFREFRLFGLNESPTSFARSAADYSKTSNEEVARRLECSDPGFTLGAFLNEQLIGVVGISYREGEYICHKAHLWGLYVHPNHRRLGLGRRLLEEAISYASQIPKLKAIELAVVTSNSKGLDLYKAVGFTSWGREPLALRIDSAYLELEHMILEL